MRLYQASPTRAWAIVLLRVRFDLVSWVLQVLRGGASSCTLISSPQGQLSHDARVRGMASSMQLSDINVVPVQTGRVHMVFGGNISHKQTPVMVRMTTDPVMVLGGSMGWVITMASGAVQVTHIRVFLTTLKSPYLPLITVPTPFHFSFSPISPPAHLRGT